MSEYLKHLRYVWLFTLKVWHAVTDALRLMLPDRSFSSRVCFGMAILCITVFVGYSIGVIGISATEIMKSLSQQAQSDIAVAEMRCENHHRLNRQIDALRGDEKWAAQAVRDLMARPHDEGVYFCLLDTAGRLAAAPYEGFATDSAFWQNYGSSRLDIDGADGTSGWGVDMIVDYTTLNDTTYCGVSLDIEGTDYRVLMLRPASYYKDKFFELLDLFKLLGVCLLLMAVGYAVMFFMMRRAAVTRDSIEGEVDVAAQLQQKMVPQQFPAFPDNKAFDLYGVLRPAKLMGGDLYDFMLRDNHLIFCLGDVSGKGMPAALVMSVAHCVFRSAACHQTDVALIASMINEAVAHGSENNMFCTCFIGSLDLETHVLSYCNAGHNQPVVLDAEGKARFLDVKPNIALGVIEEFAYQSEQVELSAGTTFLVYSDGVTEAESMDKRLFGDQAVIGLLDGQSAQSPKQTVEHILERVQLHARFAEQSDDITMLCLKVLA